MKIVIIPLFNNNIANNNSSNFSILLSGETHKRTKVIGLTYANTNFDVSSLSIPCDELQIIEFSCITNLLDISFVADVIIQELSSIDYSCIILNDCQYTHQIANYISIRLSLPLITRVRNTLISNHRTIYQKNVYNQSLTAEFSCYARPYILTIQSNNDRITEKKERINKSNITKKLIPLYRNQFFSSNLKTENNILANDLSSSNRLVIVGRGIKTPENVALAQKYCNKIGACLGSTRGAFLDGLTNESQIIGISGLISQAYYVICLGVSGAPAFMAGIEKSHTIISINSDANANIFNFSNYGLIANCEDFLKTSLSIK